MTAVIHEGDVCETSRRLTKNIWTLTKAALIEKKNQSRVADIKLNMFVPLTLVTIKTVLISGLKLRPKLIFPSISWKKQRIKTLEKLAFKSRRKCHLGRDEHFGILIVVRKYIYVFLYLANCIIARCLDDFSNFAKWTCNFYIRLLKSVPTSRFTSGFPLYAVRENGTLQKSLVYMGQYLPVQNLTLNCVWISYCSNDGHGGDRESEMKETFPRNYILKGPNEGDKELQKGISCVQCIIHLTVLFTEDFDVPVSLYEGNLINKGCAGLFIINYLLLIIVSISGGSSSHGMGELAKSCKRRRRKFFQELQILVVLTYTHPK
ncbi:hypothetical protein NQ317_004229 [Molorchus minor]|uniref:Uncharacterized protein n=1 Tax=Molorchus minor TaxID=1323400 RepID=A0ABQ9J0R2_9CUCU|nr:hypothetical protein NQ317_004229 [Molorchus minor]